MDKEIRAIEEDAILEGMFLSWITLGFKGRDRDKLDPALKNDKIKLKHE
jgi:hypothetical protein